MAALHNAMNFSARTTTHLLASALVYFFTLKANNFMAVSTTPCFTSTAELKAAWNLAMVFPARWALKKRPKEVDSRFREIATYTLYTPLW